MPASPEACLLSAVCRTGDYKTLIKTGVTADMFHQYPDEGKWLFTYITRHKKTPSKGALRNTWPGVKLYAVDDVEWYAEEVRRAHAQDAMMSMLDKVVDAIESDDTDLAMRVIQQGVMEVQSRSHGVSAHYNAFEDWDQTYAEVASRVDRVATRGLAGVPSGFHTLDSITGGFQPGWFCVVAARLGQGKTWTGIRMGFAAACMDTRVGHYSLEMNKHQVAMRIHSFASKKYGQYAFNSMDLNRGQGFDLREYKKFLGKLKDQVGDGKYLINDSSRGTVTPQTIAAGIENDGFDIVFIDYLTLMGTSGDDWRATARLSAELQGVAQRYQVPIVGLAQVNRLGAGKEPPSADNLSQADAIGQDADLLVTMAQQCPDVMKLKVAKFRHGPGGGTWHCKFSPGTGQYEEITGQQAQDMIEKSKEVE